MLDELIERIRYAVRKRTDANIINVTVCPIIDNTGCTDLQVIWNEADGQHSVSRRSGMSDGIPFDAEEIFADIEHHSGTVSWINGRPYAEATGAS